MATLRDDSLGAWNLAIDDGLEFRRKYGREGEWAKSEALYYNAHKSQEGSTGPNIIAGTGDALLSTLLVPNPYYVLKALRMDTIEGAPVLESQLNTLIYALGMKETLELVGLHAYLYGKGIVKTGYDSEFGYCPEYDIAAKMGQVVGLSLTQFNKSGQKIEFDSRITPGMPWTKAVLPHDFVVPWGTGWSLRDCPWAAHRIIRHVDDVKSDPKYENKGDLQPTMSMADWVQSYLTVMKPYRAGRSTAGVMSTRDESDDVCYVEMWEIHDVRTGRVKVIANGHDEWLRNEIDYLQEDGLPFSSLGFVPGARTFWTTPDSVYLQGSQDEAIDIAAMQRRQRRISLLRFLYQEGSIESDEIDKFMSGEIGIGVKFKQPGADGKAPITAMTAYNNNDTLDREANSIRSNAREAVGISRNQMGEYESTGRRTATEAGIVEKNADQRLDRRQQAVADIYCDLGRKLSKIIFKFWRTPRLVEMIGLDGAAGWTSFIGSDLKGEYQFKVGFSSEPVKGLQARRLEAMNLFVTLSMDPSIDQRALRRMLSRAYNDPEFTSLFLPGVINNAALSLPMSQQMQTEGEGAGKGGGGGEVGRAKSKPEKSGGNGSPVPDVQYGGQPRV